MGMRDLLVITEWDGSRWLSVDDVKIYLDECIDHWRSQADAGNPEAKFYVDAFQSIRTSLLGELKP
jgi:hypothetical protein